MNETFSKITKEIDSYISNLEKEHKNDRSRIAEMAIYQISCKLAQVKQKFENDYSFLPGEEVFYFKNIKSHLMALLQYYNAVQKIEIRKPPLKKKLLKKYYLKELYKVKQKIKRKHFYYNYYKSKSTHLDKKFFKRLETDLFIPINDTIIDVDKRYTTPMVMTFAHIGALDMLRDYLKEKTKNHDSNTSEAASVKPKLKWTASKADLIESIYALHSAGAFNHGKADLKEIAEYFEEIFDIDLGQYTRVFYDIRSRKTNKTKFLHTLKQALIKRMSDTDNELFL